jgi:AraC-like DNA-binding protein
MSVIRGTSLLGYPDLVTELGVDPNPLLNAAGIAPEAVGNQDAFIAYRGLVAAVESAAVATGAADFGRRLALRQGLEILGPLAVAARTAPTTGKALQALHRYGAHYSPAIATSLDQPPGADHARLEFQVALPRLPSHRQVIELSLGVFMRSARVIIGSDFRPLSVHLPHDALAPEREYQRYFGCPVRFAEPYSGFLLRVADLSRPLRSDTAVHDVVQQYLRSITPPASGTTVTASVRVLVRRLLPTGNLDRDLIAGHLSMHPRTLQRRLAAEGTTFADLVDAVRREEAERYLRETDMYLGRLAGILGYSEQSVLTRACQRWFGTTGTRHRKALYRALSGMAG